MADHPPVTPQMSPNDTIAENTHRQARPAFVRAGRLAGRAVIAAWIISVAYHAVIFTIMFLIPWISGIARNKPDTPPPFTDVIGQIDQPVASLSPSPKIANPTEAKRSDPLKFKPKQFRSMDNLAPKLTKDLDIIGIGSTSGDLDADGFSIPIPGTGPDFFGLGAQARGARRIVYVVDRSASMQMTFHGVIAELQESISKLRRSQKFHVIFFSTGPPLENPPRRLVSAIKAHKRDAFRFFKTIQPQGGTDPRIAFKRAFAVDPDLIYFLTDGDFEGVEPAVMAMLRKINRGGSVRIFTVAYVSPAGGAVLERIAREHNGEYRFVTEDEIF